jgi:hypothetical protein
VVEQEWLAAKAVQAPAGSDDTATGPAPHKERPSKLAADSVLAKGPSLSEPGAAGSAQKSASTDAVIRATRPEEVLRSATAHLLPSLTFAEMHKALGDLHVVRNFPMEYGISPVPEGRFVP